LLLIEVDNTFPTFFPNGSLATLIATAAIYGLMLLLPLSIGFAVLRSRLWDIDTIINRTLVYGLLTAIVALLYFGLVFMSQFLLRGMIQQDSPIAIVASTLVIAALIQPLRGRIQSLIDRRFYRRRYNAARIIATFAATLRNEVDLNKISEDLVAVVQETMQPTHVSLWLRQNASSREQITRMLPPIEEE
jgi:K+-sensing histidine kinase KdpD